MCLIDHGSPQRKTDGRLLTRRNSPTGPGVKRQGHAPVAKLKLAHQCASAWNRWAPEVDFAPTRYRLASLAVTRQLPAPSAVLRAPVGGVPDMMEAERHGPWVNAGRLEQTNDADRAASGLALLSRLADATYSHVLANYGVEAVNSHLLEICSRIDQSDGHIG